MPDNLVLAGLAPHPPIIIPEVGRGEERDAIETINAMDQIGKVFSSAGIQTLVVITPHGPVFSDAVSIPVTETLEGDLRQFGAGGIGVRFKNDLELIRAIEDGSRKSPVKVVTLDKRRFGRYGIESKLDHGVLVPMYYLQKHGFNAQIAVVNIGFLPYFDLYLFGKQIAEAALRVGRKIGVLASGDLSHRLQPGAPAGYNEQGKVFDEFLVDKLRAFSVEEVVCMPSNLIENAGECGLRPISIMLGALDGAQVEPQVLSYEGPFGVGYCVALFRPVRWSRSESRIQAIRLKRQKTISRIRQDESFPASLARTTVEHYVSEGRLPAVEGPVPSEFCKKAGVFVSIHKEGDLRGCIGTTEPTTGSIAQEIMQNAVSAATRDPRFSPVTLDELEMLDYSVDILSDPVEVKGFSELNPRKYGVICVKGNRKGLLLPDLPGVNTVREQLSIAKRKAGISPFDTQVKIYRFTVSRYR